MKKIAIIPARSGSKGLKDKNIKLLNGKALIAYTIEGAINSKMFDKVVVSTDSRKYAEISKEFGAEVPFLRSEENSTDKAGTMDAIKEVLSNLEESFDLICILQPTSPLRTSKNIVEAFELFKEKNADTVIGICETPHPMFWCNTLDKTLSMENFVRNEHQVPRQQLPKSYTINGAIYIFKASQIEDVDFYSNKSYAYVMNKKQSIDIDDEFDFLYAEHIIKNLSQVSEENYIKTINT